MLERNSGIFECKYTYLWNVVPNSERRQFFNCTSILSGAVHLGGRSVWYTDDDRRSPVYHTDRRHLSTTRWSWSTASRGSVSGSGDLLIQTMVRQSCGVSTHRIRCLPSLLLLFLVLHEGWDVLCQPIKQAISSVSMQRPVYTFRRCKLSKTSAITFLWHLYYV